MSSRGGGPSGGRGGGTKRTRTDDGNQSRHQRPAWFMSACTGHLYGNGKHYSDEAEAGGFKQGDRLGVLVDLDAGAGKKLDGVLPPVHGRLDGIECSAAVYRLYK